MRKSVAAVAIALAVGGGAWAGGDKSQESFVDITSLAGGSAGFTNFGVSVGKSKSGKCQLQVQLKGLTGYADGAVLICLAEADIRATLLGAANTFGNSVVLRGTVKTGQLKIKADLADIGCGSSQAINWNGGLTCFAPDANFTDLSNDLVNWKSDCSGATMLPLANPEATASSDPAKVNLLGLCQGLTANTAQRIPPPGSAKICQQGASQPVL